MSLNSNARIIAEELSKRGWKKAHIAGKLGNFQLESGFNPRINEGGKVGAPMGVGGYGIAQWTGGRQKNLINFAKQQKMDPGDINLQTKFLLYELEGPEKKAAAYLREAVSPEESARRFLTDFERAGIPKTKQRQEAARAIYGQLGFLDQPRQVPVVQQVQQPGGAANASLPGEQPLGVGAALSAALGQDITQQDTPQTIAQNLVDEYKRNAIENLFSQGIFPGLTIPSIV